MDYDVAAVVGLLMRALDGEEISRAEIEAVKFDADGALEAAVNEAFISLLKFAFDQDLRRDDRAHDALMRADLQCCLDEIARAADWS